MLIQLSEAAFWDKRTNHVICQDRSDPDEKIRDNELIVLNFIDFCWVDHCNVKPLPTDRSSLIIADGSISVVDASGHLSYLPTITTEDFPLSLRLLLYWSL